MYAFQYDVFVRSLAKRPPINILVLNESGLWFPIPTGPAGSRVSLPLITLKAANVQQGCYIYLEDLLKLSSYGSPPSTPQWPVNPSPFCLQSWGYAFDFHPDK